MDSSDQRGQHMRILRMKVVVNTIEICGHYAQKLGSMLKIEALTEFNTRNLGQGISSISTL